MDDAAAMSDSRKRVRGADGSYINCRCADCGLGLGLGFDNPYPNRVRVR